MAEEDYLADLIKKVKDARKDTAGQPAGRQGGAPERSVQPEMQTRSAAAQRGQYAQAAPQQAVEKKPPKIVIPPQTLEEKSFEEKIPEKSEVEEELEKAPAKKLIAAYNEVKIFQIPEKPLLYYFVPVARPTKQEKTIINTIKEAATRLITFSPYRIRDPEQRAAVYKQRVLEILRNSPELHIPERMFDFYAENVVREMVGYGIIDPLVRDDGLEEIMIIGAGKPVYLFHREYEMMTSNIEFYSEKEIIDLINRIARQVGRRVDISMPLLDARLPDGSRVNATIPPASVDGATLTIRKFRKDPYSIIDLMNLNTMTPQVAAFLWMCVDGLGAKPANILIAGGTSSGKTTMLNCLASFIPETERIITIEDTAELSLPLRHWIRLEARPPGMEGKGELTLDILTKNSLRMRPDRILVGEVRHDEAFTLFTAMNTGHEGAVAGDTLVQLGDGNIAEIGCIAEKLFENKTPIKEGAFEFVEAGEQMTVPCLNKQTLKIENRKITHVWRKKASEKACRIKLRSGKQLRLTADHPVYRISNGIQEIGAGEARQGDFIAVPKEIGVFAEKELAKPYLAGLIYGDGHLGKEAVQFVNGEESLIQAFSKEMAGSTKNKVSRFDYDGFSRVQVYDRELIKKINRQYEMPIGNKTKTFKLVENTLKAKNSELAALLRGLFDCESHVNLHSNSIQFATSNPDLAKKAPLMLMRFGIASSTYVQKKDGKGNRGPYFIISIGGKENLQLFAEKIGFSHEKKAEKLGRLLEKAKGSLDSFPNIGRLIKNARLEARMTQAELGALLGAATRSSIRAYETSARSPSRNQLGRICGALHSETAGQLRILQQSGIRFEEIVSAEEGQFDGYVYDLTVEANHNYIANGVIVSNCMGTVHANSPQETIVRVTNPPMNVPEVMLSGLDLILIEHKIHDKRKGTIRRITEIAEVSGVLLKHAQTQTIFQRNPVQDTIEWTNTPIKYLKILQDFTGMTKIEIENEWKQRETFLTELARRSIRDLFDVKKATQQYTLQQQRS